MRESSSVASLVQGLRQEAQRLAPGSRLPSVRALMARHRVSPGTVRQAMARLAEEGVLDARPGQGTFVGAVAAPRVGAAPDFAWQASALGPGRITADDVATLLAGAPAGAINLAGGYPAEDLQAVDLAARALARAARRPGVWGRVPLEGLDGLRAWFARQLGPTVTAREVVICPGSQAAIATAFNALTQPGDAVLVESPSYVGAMAAARAAGLRLVPVPTDAHGVVPDLLARAFDASGARVFYTQPLHANPTGATLAAARRAPLLDVVVSRGALVVEDDWCRDLSFDKAPPRPLFAADVHGHAVYLRSLTKSTAPGLRIGAIVARGAALARLTASRAVTEFFVSGPMQEAALEVVHAPAWQRHLRRVRSILVGRRDALVAAARQHLGPASVAVVPSGGIHLWVRLPDDADSDEVARRAAAAGVVVSPGRRWFPAEPTGSFLRVSYACADEPELLRGVEVLARLVTAVPSRRATRSSARARR
ncbi:MAG: PLP-dependent aminotransferase family protein [Vicinamibacterales bacterium]